MTYVSHVGTIEELSASEGIFTTAQAASLGVPRNALSHAVSSGRAERVLHGAYKLTGVPSNFTDELSGIWKLTAPDKFIHERMQVANWDGIVVGGTTAASLHNIGDFYLSPYRIYSPKRINSRNESARFSTRQVDSEDVTWIEGLPVTCRERTLVDLCLDDEDWSLVEDAFVDAVDQGIAYSRLRQLLADHASRVRDRESLSILNELMEKYPQEEYEDWKGFCLSGKLVGL